MSDDAVQKTSDPRDAYFDVAGLTPDLGRQTGRSASVVLLFSVMRLAITLVSTGILARLVPPDQQGQVAMILPLVLIASGLSEFGLPQAVIQRPHITHSTVSALFWINVVLGLVLTGIAAALAPLAVSFYDAPEVMPLLIVLSPYILLTVLTVPYVAILRRRMEIRLAEACSFIGVVVAAVLAVIAAWFGAGPWALVVQILAAQVTGLLCVLAVVHWRPSAPWRSDISSARSALIFGGHLSLDRLVGGIVQNMQTALVGRAFGEVAAGLFFRSETFAVMPRRRLIAPLSGAFVPALSRLQAEPEAFREMYIRFISRGHLIVIPVGLLICIAPDMFVRILLGDEWLMAIPILGWLGVLPLISLFGDANIWVMIAMGKTKELLYARLVSSAVLVAALIGAMQFDLVTFVALYVAAQAVISLVYMPYVATKHSPLDFATMRRAIGSDIVFAGVLALAMVALRQFLTLPDIAEGLVVALMVCAAQGVRIVMTPQYRKDVRALLRRSPAA